MDYKVIVIIVTFNAQKWLERCLGSVRNSTISLDCIIIDNHSSDNTINEIKERYPEMVLVESQENLGFGRANNIGLEYAVTHGYDFVYLLNQDAWIFPNTIEELIRVSAENPNYWVISPLQKNRGLNKLDNNFAECCTKEMLSDTFCNNLKSIYETRFVMAAHWLLPIHTILCIGGFSSSFPHYGEDHNYIHRVQYFGGKIGISPCTSAVHDREFRYETKSLLLKKNYLRSVVLVSNPNVRLVYAMIIAPFQIIRRSYKINIIKVLGLFIKLLYNYPRYIKNRLLSKQKAFLQ